MKTLRKFFSVILLFVLLLVPTQSVSAQGLFDGPVIFGGSYTVEGGETLNGDLVVFGGVILVEEGALVTGSVVLIGGTLTINGEVEGDVVAVGGAASLGENAIVHGDLATAGASLHREEGSIVEGETIYNTPGFSSDVDPFIPVIPAIPGAPEMPFVPNTPVVVHTNPLWTILGVFGRSLAMGLLAMLVALFLAEPTRRVGQAVIDQPAVAGGLGFLTVFVAPLAILVLALTIILAPIAILAVLLFLVAILYGWIALGIEVGERFTKMLKQEWALPLSAGFGAFLLTLISASVELIPCIGWLMPFIIGTLALGGVIMSRFGSQAVLPPAAPVVDAAPLPPVDGEPVG